MELQPAVLVDREILLVFVAIVGRSESPLIALRDAAFQAIADANGGTRAAGTPGYDASVDYVA